MKQFFIFLTVLIAQIAKAQTVVKPGSETFLLGGKTETVAIKAGLPFGKLQLFYWGNNKAYFKLKYISGTNSKNMGFADDTLTILNNQAIYHSKEDSSCKLGFTIEQNAVNIEQVSKPGSFACGFGRNVFVDGKYSKVVDAQKAKIALGKHPLSLQWIGWEQPGTALITDLGNGLYQIKGQQQAKTGSDFLRIDGLLQVVSERELLFNGTIENKVSFNNKGASCLRKGIFHFKAASGKKYWRLQEMQNCEGGMVVDYVDLYY